MKIDPQQLGALASQLKFKFIDGEPRQTVQHEGFAPIYFRNLAEDHSDNLPGGSCGETIRNCYADSDSCYEPVTTAFFIWLRKQWPTLAMIDVGARWGEISFIAASIFERSIIHAFEMNPLVSEILQKNVDLNRHLPADFHIQNMLVSKFDKQTLVTFRHFTARYGASEGGINLSSLKIIRENIKSKLKKIIFRRPTHGEYMRKQIRISTIDTYCHENNFTPNLIKIDVEGSEYDVLLGAQNTLLCHHPVLVVEFHTPGDANYIRKSNRELVRLLEELKYECLWINHRIRNAPIYQIDSRTELDLEINSLGIFY
jgi:FkbM family methyltransferase